MSNASKGFLSRFKTMLQRNRLGELMVMSGFLTTGQLHYALARQKVTGDHLGRVLVSERMVSRPALYRVLAQQYTLRSLLAFTTVFLTISTFNGKTARAGTIPDVPSEMSLVTAANSAFSANTAFTHVSSYPILFNTAERKSENLDAFVKWSGMFNKFETAMHQRQNQATMTSWENGIKPYAGMPLEQMARGVNNFVNQEQYVTDQDNWHVSDYWETPIEFFQRGGDCEDFAIAKYVSLRALGVPDDRMRVAIVQDEEKNMPHAILIVYTDRGPVLLDNQIKDIRYTANVNRYRPIFTINRTAWWLHTAPGTTMVASAN